MTATTGTFFRDIPQPRFDERLVFIMTPFVFVLTAVGVVNAFVAQTGVSVAFAAGCVVGAIIFAVYASKTRKAAIAYADAEDAEDARVEAAEKAFLSAYGIEASVAQCDALGFPVSPPAEPGVLGSSVVVLGGKAVPVTLAWDGNDLVLTGPNGELRKPVTA